MTKGLAIVALVLLTSSSAAAAGPLSTGTLPLPANRIVGLWSTSGDVGPCGGPATMHVTNYLLFNTGGTVIENIPPTPARNQGMGTWSYGPTGWQLRLRFDRFADGAYVGYTIIDRNLLMSPDGAEVSGPVNATFYAPDGTVIFELCGDATSTRLQ